MAHLVLYDGVCGLCNRAVQFILQRDHRDRFVFAALQSPRGTAELARFGRTATELDTFYLIADHGTETERLLQRGRAALLLLWILGGPWKMTGILQILPTWMLDAIYGFVARRRYRWFGRFDACPVPSPETRRKFLDVP